MHWFRVEVFNENVKRRKIQKNDILPIEIHEYINTLKIVPGDTKKVSISCPTSQMNRLNYVTVYIVYIIYLFCCCCFFCFKATTGTGEDWGTWLPWSVGVFSQSQGTRVGVWPSSLTCGSVSLETSLKYCVCSSSSDEFTPVEDVKNSSSDDSSDGKTLDILQTFGHTYHISI